MRLESRPQRSGQSAYLAELLRRMFPSTSQWEDPKGTPAAVCQEILWVALRNSWTGPSSPSPLEISGGAAFGGLSRLRVDVTALSIH